MTYFDKLPENIKSIANQRNKMDGIDFLKQFDNNSVPAIFFDPQYRGVLDSLKYGNEGSRQKGRSELLAMSASDIMRFVSYSTQILIPSGYLFLWLDKFHLVEGISDWYDIDLEDDDFLYPVDLITWNKGKIGMGYRTRRKCEYLLILQKEPKRAKSTWTRHDIPDVWDEKVTDKSHPHSKPIALQQALIEATVHPGDFVIDPCAGSFSVMEAAKQCGRNFIGVDIKG